MIALTDGVWIDSAPIRIIGMPLSATMTVLRLADGGLLLHSPLALSAERCAAVNALGRVTHLYAPNTFHHLRIGEWAAAYPEARLHAPRGLAKKRPELRVDRFHDAGPDPDLAQTLDELPIAGFRLEENVLFHRPSRTLVVADLVHNVGRPTHWWAAVYTRLMGFHGRVAMSRLIRWAAFPDRPAARRSVAAVLQQPIERLVVGHGAPLITDAHATLAQGCRWLTG